MASAHSTVADPSATGRDSAVPSAQVIGVRSGVTRRAMRNMVDEGSTPVARAPRRAAIRAAVPGPHPTSTTWSSGPSWAMSAANLAFARPTRRKTNPHNTPVIPAKPGWSAW
ncbi:hypothetical protein BN975_00940 [Mycolicibacterium farcinogenes]|nr:hypothetical protein BN975_00940 [Mycolicibacterium farcinogenes]